MKLKLINGNGNLYETSKDLTIIIKNDFLNDTWLKLCKDKYGLKFVKKFNYYYCKPKSAMSVVKFLTNASTHLWKVAYTNNASTHNTLFFKSTERTQEI